MHNIQPELNLDGQGAVFLTADEMRAAEAAAFDSGLATGRELMERAGEGVVAAIFAQWPETRASGGVVSVLCGPGNNGGDGFVVARLLTDWGWRAQVFLLGDAAKLPPDARANHDLWTQRGEVHPLSGFARETAGEMVIDALFGTGLMRPLDGEPARIAQVLAERHPGPRIVSVDIASGICADSGRVLGAALPSDLTVSFHAAKRGHVLDAGGAHAAALRIVDIGLRAPDAAAALRPVTGDTARPMIHRLPGGAHKYDHGHALILSGPAGRTGAARLAARGALRIGAGLVTLAAPSQAMAECAAQLTAIMLADADSPDFDDTLADPRLGALCLGPGLGTDDEAAERVASALATGKPAVLDADALSLIAVRPNLRAALHDACLVTPHMGEFARLCPDIATRLRADATKGPAYSRADAARDAAQDLGVTVLLKGADTVIAAPDGRMAASVAHYARAVPWLATAGAGDVLAGFVAGLLARGQAPFEAACAGAWLHVSCARAFGPGLIAEDLPETVPRVLAGG